MSRFTRLVVATLLLFTLGALSTPTFAASSIDTHDEFILTRWEALIQHALAWFGIDSSPRGTVDAKDGAGDPLPEDPNKPPAPPDEASHNVDPFG